MHLQQPGARLAQARFDVPVVVGLPFLRGDLVAGGAGRRRCRRISAGARTLSARGLPRGGPAHRADAPPSPPRSRAAYGLPRPPRVVHNGRRPLLPRAQRHAPAARRLHGRAALGRRQGRRGARPRRRRCCELPLLAAGPLAGTERRARRRRTHLVRSVGSTRQPLRRFSPRARLRLARALRAVRPRGAGSRAGRLRPRAVRHPDASASCGTAPPSSSPPDDAARSSRRRSPRSPIPGRRAALGDAARERARRYSARQHGRRDACSAIASVRRRGAPKGCGRVRLVYFTHSLASCWNHGNAHFLRGVLRELRRARPRRWRRSSREGAWSLAQPAARPRRGGARRLPGRLSGARRRRPTRRGSISAQRVDGADLVIVHEWNDPALVAALGAARARGARFTLLFHDTHHRAVSDPEAIRALRSRRL